MPCSHRGPWTAPSAQTPSARAARRAALLITLAVVGGFGPAARAAPPADSAEGPAAAERPNIVLVLADDLGYGDLGCYGGQTIRTPRLDRLAREGTRFTDFYVAQAVCTASRAALLTGCYPTRVSLFGALNHESNVGIAAAERLLPELLHQAGYATAIYGKWHLGHRPPFLPTRHGFDEFAGLPYSNDNGPLHPTMRGLPPLPWYEQEQVVSHDPDQSQFTRQLTDRAIAFMERHRERPFFIYLPHIMPHVPIFASEAFRGRSPHGPYADVVEELDQHVGRLVDAIDRLGLGERTLVIFASDNGPFLSYGNHAGSAGPLREGKLTTFEGGVRVPCLMRWTGTIPAGGTCRELAATIDLLPTLARWAGAELPALPIDGRDMRPLILGTPGAKSPHEAYLIYAGDELQAVRSGRWKLHLKHSYLSVHGPPGRDGKPARHGQMAPLAMSNSGLAGIASRHGYTIREQPLALFDLQADVGETRNVAAQHLDVVARLQAVVERARRALGDSLTGVKGSEVRPSGSVAATSPE